MKIKNYSKRMVVTALTLFSVSLPSILNAQGEAGCRDLFISEIVKDNVSNNGTPYSNYVIELFNPTLSAINVGNYNLEFRDANNNVYNLGLTGIIPSFGTYAVSHKNAENNVKALMQMDTTLLDFSIYTQVKLVNKITNIVIDAFGQPISQATITFNYLLFMQDPASYLSQYNLTLSDLDHVDLRRGFFVNKGTPVFNPNTVIGTWAFYTGTDHTDLKKHQCVCNAKPGALPTVGYLYAGKTLDEKISLNNAIDDLDLQVSGYAGTPLYITQLLTGGTAVVNTHIVYYAANSANPNNCSYNNAGPNCTYARTLDNLFVGNKLINSAIQPSTFGDFNVDASTKNHAITIRGNGSTGVKEYDYSILPITVFPSTTSDILNIKGNIDCKYFITSLDGKQVQEGVLYNSATIDVSSLSSCMYIINFYNYSGKKTDKFIKD